MAQFARRPSAAGRQYAKFVRELGTVVAGRSTLAPASGDRRFADAAWTDNAAFRRLLQGYVALAGGLDRCVDEAGLDPAATDRAFRRFLPIVDAIAPTNFIATNPAALRKLADTKG
jgi:polyhydroxyalkanoate synthase